MQTAPVPISSINQTDLMYIAFALPFSPCSHLYYLA